MKFVFFVSNDFLNDLFLKKLNKFFNEFKLVNLDEEVNVFELNDYFNKNEIYVLDFCNNLKSQELLAFIATKKTKSCFDLKYLYRSFFHFKYSAKFFELLEIPSLKMITGREIKIYNRAKDHTIEFLNGFPINFNFFESSDDLKIATDKESFNYIYNEFLAGEKAFFLVEHHNPEDFLECVFLNNNLKFVYSMDGFIDLDTLSDEVRGFLRIIADKIPLGLMTFRLVKSKDKYVFSDYTFGLNFNFIRHAENSDLKKIINVTAL